MNSSPMFILSDNFTLNILKEQTTMIAGNYYPYRAGCPYRKNLINLHKHSTDTDIQEISLSLSSP